MNRAAAQKSSTGCVVYADPAALPDAAAGLFAAPEADLFASRDWFDLVIAHALPPTAAPLFAAVGGALLAPLRTDGCGRAAALACPYTGEYAPALAPGLDVPARLAASITLCRALRHFALVRLEAMPDGEWIDTLRAAARAAGIVALPFAHFGNWHEAMAGRDFAAYLAARPGALRGTIRRRRRQTEADPALRVECLRDPAEMARGIAAYQHVYARSWKPEEPFPGFIPALMERAAARGLLRLGLVWRAEAPIAAQLWIVSGGTGFVLKLAHDEAEAAHSPGTVLTASVLADLIDREHVQAIDFGRGDDAYKQGWAKQRRQRMGVLLANPRHPLAWPALARHGLGLARQAIRPRSVPSSAQ